MTDFQLDENAVQGLIGEARRQAERGELRPVVERAQRGDTLDPIEIAQLWFAPRIDTQTLYERACEARCRRPVALETFSPLYLTNTCDAECRMCGMRRDNQILHRQTADLELVEEQLRLLAGRGMHAVALLTGEYRAARRPWALGYVNQALRATQQMHFNHVLINVGSIDASEYNTLLQGIERRSDGAARAKLTMCTFQETYARRTYAKFMGTDPDNPRADYERRLTNFDRAYRAGIRVANPGILIGLNPDLVFELLALVLHARHLLARGMQVYLSVPRLRQIAGNHDQRGAEDGAFIRLVSILSLALPTCKIVLTTREPSPMQHRLVPIVAVLSAGSAAVAPYTGSGARFPLDSSQFEVIDQRPFEAILGEHLRPNGIVNYAPQGPWAE